MLEQNAFLGGLASLVDDGRLAGHADMAALKQKFGSLTSLEEWLARPGEPLLKAAIGTKDATVALH